LIRDAVTHYDALEVSPNASPEVIRAAYRSLMQRFHPDRNPGDEAVAARAAVIAQAYAVLSDADKRAEYNQILQRAAEKAVPFAQGGRPSADAGSNRASRSGTTRPVGPRGNPGAVSATHVMRIGLWCLLFLFAAGGFWAFASRTGKKIEPRAELVSIRQAFASAAATEAQKRELYSRKLAILEQYPELLQAASAEKFDDMAARTFSLLETPLAVVVTSEKAGISAELTIQHISFLVGSFDAPVLLAHLATHRESLIQDLSARLAKESLDRFASPDAEEHLKRLLLEITSASLRTGPAQDYPSTYFESPGRYGVVDVLLPERFKLIQLNSLR
jgi:curved DNA-binding protein CbpA